MVYLKLSIIEFSKGSSAPPIHHHHQHLNEHTQQYSSSGSSSSCKKKSTPHVLFKEIPKTPYGASIVPLKRGRPSKRKHNSSELEMNITRTDILTCSNDQQTQHHANHQHHGHLNIEQLIQPYEKEFQIIHVNKKQKKTMYCNEQFNSLQQQVCYPQQMVSMQHVVNMDHLQHDMHEQCSKNGNFTFVNENCKYEKKNESEMKPNRKCRTSISIRELLN